MEGMAYRCRPEDMVYRCRPEDCQRGEVVADVDWASSDQQETLVQQDQQHAVQLLPWCHPSSVYEFSPLLLLVGLQCHKNHFRGLQWTLMFCAPHHVWKAPVNFPSNGLTAPVHSPTFAQV